MFLPESVVAHGSTSGSTFLQKSSPHTYSTFDVCVFYVCVILHTNITCGIAHYVSAAQYSSTVMTCGIIHASLSVDSRIAQHSESLSIGHLEEESVQGI